MSKLLQKHRHNLKDKQAERLLEYLGRQPAIASIYRCQEELMTLLTTKNQTKSQCRLLVYQLLEAIATLKQSGFEECEKLGPTLENWRRRPLAEVWYLILDARYEKVRIGGIVRDAAVLSAIGIGANGHRQLQGVSVAERDWRGQAWS